MRISDWSSDVCSSDLEATPERIYEAAFDSAVTKLDRFSRYLTADAARAAQAARNGYTGIGITIVEREGRVYVTTVFEQSPASEAGVQPGDRIASIDGGSADGLTIGEVADRLRGPSGSSGSVARKSGV